MGPMLLQSDGTNVWVANYNGGTISRVRASDGKLLETWTGADHPFGVLVALGRIFISGQSSNVGGKGFLYMIDPTQPAGSVSVITDDLTPTLME
jgi:hypothetical protein